MGCGGSRLGGVAATRAEEGGVVPLPAGIRPLLRRRLEEMKKRSHAGVLKGSQTLSKKELLRHNSSEDGEDTEENDGSLKSSAKVAPAPDHHVEEKKEVIYEKIPSRDDVKEVKEEVVVKKQEDENHHQDVVKKEEEDNKEVVNKKQEEDNIHDDDVTINDKKEGDDGKNHDDDEGSMSNFDERMIGPGSPSFRVYCIDVPSDDDDDDEGKSYVLMYTIVRDIFLYEMLVILCSFIIETIYLFTIAEKDGEDTRKSMETESVMTEIKEVKNI